MASSGMHRIVAVLALLPVVLSGQLKRERNEVPLKSWAAPLDWQPSQPELDLIGTTRALSPLAGTSQLITRPLSFIGIAPCRIVDTRADQGYTGAFGPPSLPGNGSRTFPLDSSTLCPLPLIPVAYSLSVTVVPSGVVGYITLYPTGQIPPFTATLTDIVPGNIVSNFAIVLAGSNGSVDVYAQGPTDVIIDINGYYTDTAVGTNTSLGLTGPLPYTSAWDTLVGYLSGGGLGNANTAIGAHTLQNDTGGGNTAVGTYALWTHTTGDNNTAVGFNALVTNSGSNNIGIGANAGYCSVTTGPITSSDGIYIGSPCQTDDNATIRIGTPGTQKAFFAAGIRATTTGNNDAIPVVVDSNGQLGTVNSSRRFKEGIQDMGDASTGLLRLRPVTFRYTKPFADGSKPVQYGLIAEEVEEVYPDLVAHSADGQIETVKYQVLDSMLLNEVQREHSQIVSQNDQIRALEQQIKEQQERMAKLESALAALVEESGRPLNEAR